MLQATQSFTHRMFHEFFPPPRFLEMPAVGLNIGDDAISAVELVRRKNAYAVGRFGQRPLPPGAISGGYVNDKDSVIAELRGLKDELRLTFVNASLSEEKAYLFRTSIPRVSRKEIRSVLEFKLEENVPLPAHESIFDYSVIRESGHSEDHFDVSVTVLPEKVVATYGELINGAGLTAFSFETEAQAIARAVVQKGDRRTSLIVNFGEAKSGLFIVSDEVVNFTSTVAIGGVHIVEALAKSLSVGKEEAKAILREPVALRDRKNMDLFFSLMSMIAALKDEVGKLSMYWQTRKENDKDTGKKIERIILTGRNAAFPGFDDYLALSLNTPVSVGNVWVNTCSFSDYIPPIPFAESLDFAAAVGLALPKGH